MFPPRVRHIFRAMTAKFWWVSLLVLALALHFQSAPFVKESWPKRLESITESGVLRVLVPNAPETFHSATVDFREFDRALSNAFAERLGLSVAFVEVEPGPPMLRALRKGEADLAVGTPLGVEAPVTLSTPILDYQLQLIRHRDTPKLEFSEDLSFQLVVAANSEESQALAALASHQPNLKWVETTDLNREEILNFVTAKRIDYTAILGPDFRRVRALFPELTVDRTLGESLAIGWAFPETADLRLVDAANTFISDEQALVDNLIEQHINQPPAQIADVKTFTQQIDKRLPEFEPLFKEAALLTGWDWRLLVAVAYQESHLNPNARSPTGVRGIMMLTLNTMRELGYESRLDPKQSIEGGARYLEQLRNRLPERITEPDRTWFTLAAYNMGLGHLEDARVLTQRQGGNPDRWEDVEARLPLLQQRQYYQSLKFGFGRGEQARTYVANIQQYYQFLIWRSEFAAN
jgi:membrane-bound lytic murein transglycosylase F